MLDMAAGSASGCMMSDIGKVRTYGKLKVPKKTENVPNFLGMPGNLSVLYA